MKITRMESFPTIDQCVVCLTNLGCKWDYNKEEELNNKKSYTHNGTVVLYDKYEILHL